MQQAHGEADLAGLVVQSSIACEEGAGRIHFRLFRQSASVRPRSPSAPPWTVRRRLRGVALYLTPSGSSRQQQ
jgi:hypothetical protein